MKISFKEILSINCSLLLQSFMWYCTWATWTMYTIFIGIMFMSIFISLIKIREQANKCVYVCMYFTLSSHKLLNAEFAKVPNTVKLSREAILTIYILIFQLVKKMLNNNAQITGTHPLCRYFSACLQRTFFFSFFAICECHSIGG